jgi:hypothetical protein
MFALVSAAIPLVVGCAAKNAAAPAGSDCTAGAGTACTCANGTASQCGATGCQCSATQSVTDTPPCDVQTVLQAHCWECHGSEPKYGAPALVTASAFRAMAMKDPSKTVGALAAIRIQDPTQRMPPAGNPALAAPDIAVLQSWANNGNPAGVACASPPAGAAGGTATGSGGAPSSNPPPAGGTAAIASGGTTTGIAGTAEGSGGGAGAGGTLSTGSGGTASVGSGGTTMGAAGMGATELPPDATCYTITARNDISNAPYVVPTTPDYYAAFSYALPWGSKKVQVIRTRSLIDNDKVIHHWLLYNNQGAVQDGAVASSIGAHPDASLVVGWAPGNEPPVLPANVGLGIPGQGFTLEVHYNNKLGNGQTDKSGVELCVTEKLRPHEAQVSWLGTQTLNKISASGTCKPALTGPVNILFSWPHEHLQGRHLTTVITRANGTQETLVDEPFDFNSQIVYSTPTVINPGDSLTTTCTYAQPTPFGQGTTSEMCYNFVTAYPGGALTNGASFLRINDCTQ